jgi:tetratricopeptide (TPR) repeat protein
LSLADLTGTPPNQVEGLFFIARAANLAAGSPGQTQIENYGKSQYVKYHGSDQGWSELLATSKATPLPPVGPSVVSAYDEQLKTAMAFWKNSQVSEASKAAAALIQSNPNRWEGYGLAGAIEKAQSKFTEAKAAYQRALSLAPDNVKLQIVEAIRAIDSEGTQNVPVQNQVPANLGPESIAASLSELLDVGGNRPPNGVGIAVWFGSPFSAATVRTLKGFSSSLRSSHDRASIIDIVPFDDEGAVVVHQAANTVHSKCMILERRPSSLRDKQLDAVVLLGVGDSELDALVSESASEGKDIYVLSARGSWVPNENTVLTVRRWNRVAWMGKVDGADFADFLHSVVTRACGAACFGTRSQISSDHHYEEQLNGAMAANANISDLYEQQLKNAMALRKNHQVSDANKSAAALIQSNPNRWEGYGLAGAIEKAQNKLADAKAANERALSMAPDNVKFQITQAIQAIEAEQQKL